MRVPHKEKMNETVTLITPTKNTLENYPKTKRIIDFTPVRRRRNFNRPMTIEPETVDIPPSMKIYSISNMMKKFSQVDH